MRSEVGREGGMASNASRAAQGTKALLPPAAEPSASLSALLARVEAATGPDRALDAAIEHATRFHRGLSLGLKPEHIAIWRHVGNGYVESQGTRYAAASYTASLDAALALCERVLPDVMWQVGFDPDDGSMCARMVTAAPLCARAKANHDTPALALLSAMLKALAATPASPAGVSDKGPGRDPK